MVSSRQLWRQISRTCLPCLQHLWILWLEAKSGVQSKLLHVSRSSRLSSYSDPKKVAPNNVLLVLTIYLRSTFTLIATTFTAWILNHSRYILGWPWPTRVLHPGILWTTRTTADSTPCTRPYSSGNCIGQAAFIPESVVPHLAICPHSSWWTPGEDSTKSRAFFRLVWNYTSRDV